ITSILDDVASMTKLAGKKTAGVLGDDVALNAEQVNGVAARRELPVVWAVAKGSVLNKIIIVPLALLLSAVVPAAINPILMLGVLARCYEGAEQIIQSLTRREGSASVHGARHAISGKPVATGNDTPSRTRGPSGSGQADSGANSSIAATTAASVS